jgi:uncharacterized protein YegL
MLVQEVVAIIDESGSMISKEEQTINGINSALQALSKEKEDNVKINVSIKFFNHNERILIRSLNIKDVRPIKLSQYVPHGHTALFDAIGNSLHYFMEQKLLDPKSYDSCLIYIVTDGMENVSKIYTSEKLKKMIENAQENYNIQLIYLGANQDAILEAAKFGIDSAHAMNYSETRKNVEAAYVSAANVASRQRSGLDTAFTPIERTVSSNTKFDEIDMNDQESSVDHQHPAKLKARRRTSYIHDDLPPKITRQHSSQF